jgi:hypothetical protein
VWFPSGIHLFGSISTVYRLGWEDSGEDNRSVEERIGEALVRIGAMSLEQVEQVLKLQQHGDNRLFGEIAIEQGFINDKAIKAYLDAKK